MIREKKKSSAKLSHYHMRKSYIYWSPNDRYVTIVVHQGTLLLKSHLCSLPLEVIFDPPEFPSYVHLELQSFTNFLWSPERLLTVEDQREGPGVGWWRGEGGRVWWPHVLWAGRSVACSIHKAAPHPLSPPHSYPHKCFLLNTETSSIFRVFLFAWRWCEGFFFFLLNTVIKVLLC